MAGINITLEGNFSKLDELKEKIRSMAQSIGGSVAGIKDQTSGIASGVSKAASQVAGIGNQIADSSGKAAAGQNQIARATSGASSKLITAASVAGNLGNAFVGAAAAAKMFNSATRIMTGLNLAASLSGWASRAGGVRAAFSQIPAAMRAIAANPALRTIVVGAAAAVVGIIAIRTAWRTAAAGANALRSIAKAVFNGLISAAHSAAGAISGVFSSMRKGAGGLMQGMPFAGMIGGLGSIAGGVALAVKSIGKAAEMETLETAFIPLLGGIEQAQNRIKELTKFAASTPFELPEIAAASKTLETLTRGAMSTGKGLTLVGDVASGTGAQFDEIAVTIGRLYDGLDSGRPVGEALMRLQELGAISGETRGKIEALQDEGLKGEGVWKIAEEALGRFSGSMKLQAGTWKGLMSTFNDTISAVMVTFGTPIMDAIKPYLESATAQLETFAGTATVIGEKIGTGLAVLKAAFESGNLMELAGTSLKLGFMNAVNFLAKGVQAAMAGAGAAFQAAMAGIEITLKAVFMGIANLLAQVLGNAAADIAQTFGLGAAASGLRGSADAAGTRAGNYFTTAKDGLSSIDPVESAKAAAKEFEEVFSTLPDFFDTSKARQEWETVFKPLKETAIAAAAAAAAKRAAIVADIVKPKPQTIIEPPVKKQESNAGSLGAFAQSMNVLFGRSANSGLLEENKRQTKLLNDIAKGLGKTPPPTELKIIPTF